MELFLTLKQYVRKTELFEIDLNICIELDLALNNLQRFTCHKIQTTNRPNRRYVKNE